MTAPVKEVWTREDYERDAQQYMASLPLEHFMEATLQATQRRITLGTFTLAKRIIKGFHFFNELMIHRRKDNGGTLRIVPDNMVVIGDLVEMERSSFAVDLEACPIFLTLEYVSESNKRKDYVDNFEKYESEFQIPYHMIFDPEEQDLKLYKHNGKRFVPIEPNEHGRLAIPAIEMEMAILDGWVRFWHKGELLPLPEELQDELDQQRQRVRELEGEVDRQTNELRQRDESLRQRDESLRQRDEALNKQQEELRQKDEALRQQKQREDGLTAMLRPLVEARARLANREDILSSLQASDSDQLMRWLAELG